MSLEARFQQDERRTAPDRPQPTVGRLQSRSGQPARAANPAQNGLLRLQSQAGNAAVTAALRLPVQRDDPPITKDPAVLPDFGNTTYLRGGPRFDVHYSPGRPVPAEGVVTVVLKVHIEFKDFEASMANKPEFEKFTFTKAQREQFGWPPAEKEKWGAKFATAVRDGWGGKHAFVLNDPDFAKYRARCEVKVEQTTKPEEANTKITAQWVPPGAPRLRSAVTGDKATLDSRDPDVVEDMGAGVLTRLVRQIKPFELDKSELTPGAEGELSAFESTFKKLREPGKILAAADPTDIVIVPTGRASSPGPVAHNKKLGQKRARVVETRVNSDLGLPDGLQARSVGETNASADADFQRVDLEAINLDASGPVTRTTQNTAAHEAGHMFGLGDEYVEEKPTDNSVLKKFVGDKPSHHGDVRREMGDEAADELLDQNSPSIMSQGSEVKRGHYVYFLEALRSVTSRPGWQVE